ncbi:MULTISPECIES: winged helix-turn-helix domain-containing protein [Halococcus]|uniref:ArsR family transcriptional regulator n=1 Tax=Halococcus salifodinae DSM 8989 TaxID=1227456 RepID=M0NF54_9EURY|nr:MULTISPECIES: helix-turn-helix domain-containing protein [Halococcus]EMA55325.1 ArsR family transcriptional regulator [Halococcus salifodinae DSM 8989]
MTDRHVGSNRLPLIPSHADPTDPAESTDTATETAHWSTDGPDGPDLETVLRSLDDSNCRAILRVLDSPKSASELREACDLSSSTVYRKLELLRDAALVREYTDVRSDGPNVTRYERDFTDVSIGITDDEFTVSIDRPERDAEDRLASFWSAMKEES